MTIDPMTFLASTSGVVAILACLYGITTLQRHDDRSNRLAAGSFLATFVGLASAPTLGTIGVGATGDNGTAGTVSLVVMTLGIGAGAGLLWNALQGFGDRPALVGYVAVAVVVAGAAALVVEPAAPRWELMPVAVLVALSYAFGAVELRHAPMASNLNSRLLEVVLWAAGPGALVIALLTGIGQMAPDSGWASLAGLLAAVALATVTSLVALRVERYGNWWSLGEERDRSELRVQEEGSFTNEARDRLDRCHSVGQPVHVIATLLPGLDELNLAYGHLAGDAALRWVSELLRRQSPPSAILGHLGAGRFAIVTSRDPELVANAVQNGMMRVPPPPTLPVRLTPVFAWASSDEAGYDLDRLRQTAEKRLAQVAEPTP